MSHGVRVQDFPPEDIPSLRDRVFQALKPRGRFAIDFIDGVSTFASESDPGTSVVREAPEKIVRRFKRYDALRGAFVAEYRNLATGETCEYTRYIYTGPILRLVMQARFRLERTVRMGADRFLDVYSPPCTDKAKGLPQAHRFVEV
jgi:hypothetical protein